MRKYFVIKYLVQMTNSNTNAKINGKQKLYSSYITLKNSV